MNGFVGRRPRSGRLEILGDRSLGREVAADRLDDAGRSIAALDLDRDADRRLYAPFDVLDLQQLGDPTVTSALAVLLTAAAAVAAVPFVWLFRSRRVQTS